MRKGLYSYYDKRNLSDAIWNFILKYVVRYIKYSAFIIYHSKYNKELTSWRLPWIYRISHCTIYQLSIIYLHSYNCCLGFVIVSGSLCCIVIIFGLYPGCSLCFVCLGFVFFFVLYFAFSKCRLCSITIRVRWYVDKERLNRLHSQMFIMINRYITINPDFHFIKATILLILQVPTYLLPVVHVILHILKNIN